MKFARVEIGAWLVMVACVAYALFASVSESLAAATRPNAPILRPKATRQLVKVIRPQVIKPNATRQLAKVTRPEAVKPQSPRLLAKAIRPQTGCVIHSVGKLA